MKSLSMVLFSLFSLLGCSQNQQKMDSINSSNFVEKVLAEVKHYDAEPMYWLNIEKQAQIEIYVNDMPLYKDFSDRRYNKSEPINHMILSSGKQRIRYRLHSNEPEVYVKIRAYYLDNVNKKELSNNVAIHEKTIKMPSSGVYEDEFVFTATVPYSNKGWTEGQDLTKLDKKELEQAVVAYYQKMWNIYNDKTKKEEQFPLFFNREIELAKSSYENKESMEEILSEYLLPYTNPSYELLPLKDYKMVYYGNGKAVALEQATLDLPFRGVSALVGKYKTEKGSTLGDVTQFILYLPKGKSLKDGLEAIR